MIADIPHLHTTYESQARTEGRRKTELLWAVAPLLVFMAVFYVGLKNEFLVPMVVLAGPVCIILAVSFAALRHGRTLGLLDALIASLFFLSIESLLPIFSSTQIRFELVAVTIMSALVFARLHKLAPTEPVVMGNDRKINALQIFPQPLVQSANNQEEAALGLEAQDARREDFLDIARTELAPEFLQLDKYIAALRQHGKKVADTGLDGLITRLERQFQKLDHTMQRLLQFARIDFEEMPFKSDSFDVSKLINETVDHAQRVSLEHKIIFLPETGKFASGDRFRVRKVLYHLVQNAIKHSVNGGKIIVGLEEREGKLSVSVRDFGEGMDDEKIANLEKAFSVSDASVRKTGLGIGLYTSNEIVRRMGGEMGVRGKRGKGTEFFFTLPIAP